MVQFVAIGEERKAFVDRNSYWKLGLSEDQSARKMIKYVEDHGYRCRGNASKAVALDAVGRYQRGLMSYEGFSVSELQSLCRAKGLSSKAKTASRLARALEKADDNATFRVLDLPAEIRNMIYELYISDLPSLGQCHLQPPLTLASRVLRAETLPIFYGCATFLFTVLSDTYTTALSYGANSMTKMPTANLSQIKNLRLAWREVGDCWSGRRTYEYLTLHLTPRNTVDKTISITGSVLVQQGTHVADALRASIRDFGYWEDNFVLQSKHIEAIAAAIPLIGRGLVR